MEHSEYGRLYDTLWHYLNDGGRQTSLFGERCQRLAREAFLSCAAGSTMPIVYLEVPLIGTPCFDLQVCIDRSALEGAVSVPGNAPAHERDLLTWLAGPQGAECAGMDLAFDLRAGDATTPQLIALLNEGSFASAEEFFELVGAPDGARRYRAAEQRVPRGWRSWYTGIIPGRSGSPVRLDYFVSRRAVRAYRGDSRLLARDLSQLGYRLSERQCGWCERLLPLPCRLNLQLDARADGTMGPVLGYNLIEGSLGPSATRQRLEGGWMRQVLEMCEAWGIADERWHQLKELSQAKALMIDGLKTGSGRVVLSITPTFLKVRMTADELVDAKAYIMCTFREMP